jgi:hypothetical protein
MEPLRFQGVDRHPQDSEDRDRKQDKPSGQETRKEEAQCARRHERLAARLDATMPH